MPRNIKYSTSASLHQICNKCLVTSNIVQVPPNIRNIVQVPPNIDFTTSASKVSSVMCQVGRGGKCQVSGGPGRKQVPPNSCLRTSHIIHMPPKFISSTNASYHQIQYQCLVTSNIAQVSPNIKYNSNAS